MIRIADVTRVKLDVTLDNEKFTTNLKNKASTEFKKLKAKVVDAVSFAD